MCSMFAYAQNTMVVHTKTGTTKFQIEELDSITFVTDTLGDQTPQGTITEENFYDDENNIKAVIHGIYYSLSQYVYLQRKIEETYCIPLLFEKAQVYPLYADDRNVNNLWMAGYNTISRANIAIRALKGMEARIAKEALAHALVIRSFVYYNMSMLWGTIPYVDENNSIDDSQTKVEIMTQAEFLPKLLSNDMMSLYNLICNGNVFVDDEHRLFEYGSLKVLLAEMLLTCKNRTEAANLLSGDTQILNIDFTDGFSQHHYISIYSDYYVDCLKSETLDLANWSINKDEYYWGCWAAYKRAGLAEEKIALFHPELKYRLLLPIPKNELKLNMNIKQNEGYEY